MNLRGLLTLLLAFSVSTWTLGCGKPETGRRGGGSSTGVGTDVPKKDTTPKATDPKDDDTPLPPAADETPLPPAADETPLPPADDAPAADAPKDDAPEDAAPGDDAPEADTPKDAAPESTDEDAPKPE